MRFPMLMLIKLLDFDWPNNSISARYGFLQYYCAWRFSLNVANFLKSCINDDFDFGLVINDRKSFSCVCFRFQLLM